MKPFRKAKGGDQIFSGETLWQDLSHFNTVVLSTKRNGVCIKSISLQHVCFGNQEK